MRKKILILIIAVAFAAALLAPVTAFAAQQFEVCHNGQTLSVPLEGALAHLNHGDAPGSCPIT